MKRHVTKFQEICRMPNPATANASMNETVEEITRPWPAGVEPTQFPTTMDWWHRQSRVPAQVAKLVHEDGLTPTKAWRIHLQLTQTQVAARMGVATGTYWQLENSEKPRKASRMRIAAALGIAEKQLDF